MEQQYLQYWEPDNLTIFGRGTRFRCDESPLVGEDKNGLIAFDGGHVEENETDLIGESLENETNQEVRGTLNPANFGKPEFILNFVLANRRALVFATSKNLETNQQKLVKNPLRFRAQFPKLTEEQKARKTGFELDVRIIVSLHEITGNPPQSTKALRNVRYQRLDLQHHHMRQSVRVTEKLVQEGRWKHRRKPSLTDPMELDREDLYKELRKLGLSPGFAARYATPPAVLDVNPFAMQQQQYIMA